MMRATGFRKIVQQISLRFQDSAEYYPRMNEEEKAIHCRIEVPAPVEKVWQAWTTEAGARAFFAMEARIEARPGGAYELYFDPSAPEGMRGSEGMQVLSIQEPEFLSFTWNAPPHLKSVRGQRTHVILRMKEVSPGLTRVDLHHDGWGDSDEWDAAYKYFVRAWGEIVLPRLKYFLEHGPIDWNHPPAL